MCTRGALHHRRGGDECEVCVPPCRGWVRSPAGPAWLSECPPASRRLPVYFHLPKNKSATLLWAGPSCSDDNTRWYLQTKPDTCRNREPHARFLPCPAEMQRLCARQLHRVVSSTSLEM